METARHSITSVRASQNLEGVPAAPLKLSFPILVRLLSFWVRASLWFFFSEKKGLTLKESTLHPQLYRKDHGKFGSYNKQLQTHCQQHEPKPNSNSNLHKRHNSLLKPQESTPRSNAQAHFDEERPLAATLRRAGVEHKSGTASRRTDDPVTHQPPPTPPSGMPSQSPSLSQK
jgi:hypothetical protein